MSSFPRRHNRGRIEASPNRRRISVACGFHGVTTVAELKQGNRDELSLAQFGFPRRHNRGRIEAIAASLPMPLSLRFHGVTTVAELKPDVTHAVLHPMLVSTASQPWPN